MSLVCKVFGHKFNVRRVDVIKRMKQSNIKFDNERYTRAYELTRHTLLDPEKEYYCKRCGHIVSGFDKFLGFYKFL